MPLIDGVKPFALSAYSAGEFLIETHSHLGIK